MSHPPTSQSTAEESEKSVRQRLYAILNDPSLSLARKQERALQLGCEYLDVESSHIERVRDDDRSHEVVASVGSAAGDLPEGTVLDRTSTYCRRTLQQHSPLAVSDAGSQGWADDPAYEEHGFDCYLGTTLFVGGEAYGTVCFVSRDPHPGAFSDADRMFVELLARLLGRELESSRQRERLAAHRRARDQSAAKYEALMDAAPAALFVADTDTGETVEVNERATTLVGYSREELLGMDQSRLHPPEQRAQYQDEMERFFEADGAVSQFADGTPLAFRHEDGTRIPVEISTSLVEIDGTQYVQGLVQDVSDRRERQEELRVKDRAMDEASAGITIADAEAADMPLVYANRAFEELTGYDRDVALGRNCRFLQGPQTDDEASSRLREAIRDRKPITTELINYRSDGTPFWNELTVTPVSNPADEVTHFVGIQRDVTGRKRREQLIGVLNRVLRHNLRNDMQTVLGCAELIAARNEGETARFAARIVDTAGDLLELSESARTIERTVRSPGETRERDVVSIVTDVTESLGEEYPAATLEVDAPDRQTVAVTDRLDRILRELGENALEHGGDSPRVRFEVAPGSDGEQYVEITVSDDGPGLPEQERDLLQGRRETPLSHGSGVGLWLVGWLTTGMGGGVTADVDETGTTVTVRIPTSGPRSTPMSPNVPGSSAGPGHD